MSQQNNNAPLSLYYQRFWQRFYREIGKAWWETVLAIIAVIVVLFCQFYFGWTKKEETVSSALINISPYVAILIAYIARHVVRTPWLLDTERQNEIGAINVSVTQLRSELDTLRSEMTRPKFTVKKPSLNPVAEFDQDDRYTFNFDLVNIGSHAALEMRSRIILAEEDAAKEPKVVDGSAGNEVPINEPIDMQLGMKLAVNEPPLYFVFGVRYKDAITKRPYSQLFFMKWPGAKRGIISEEIHHLTIQEREQVSERLKSYLTDYTSDANDSLQNVGSMPSSKID